MVNNTNTLLVKDVNASNPINPVLLVLLGKKDSSILVRHFQKDTNSSL